MSKEKTRKDYAAAYITCVASGGRYAKRATATIAKANASGTTTLAEVSAIAYLNGLVDMAALCKVAAESEDGEETKATLRTIEEKVNELAAGTYGSEAV